jgi:hypothetical protein
LINGDGTSTSDRPSSAAKGTGRHGQGRFSWSHRGPGRFSLDGAQTRTYERIGLLHGVTRERIRQLEGTIIADPRETADRGYLEN